LLLATLGLVDAGLSHKEEALRSVRRAAELRPVSQDAMDGTEVLTSLTLVSTWVGDNDGAIEQLKFLVKTPASLSYGRLKYDPAWDSIRGDPRFAELLNTLQPR